MEILFFFVVLFCLVILLAVLLQSEHKLQDALLILIFLSLGNALLLLRVYTGGGANEYLFWFALSSEQAYNGITISAAIALICFTIFMTKKMTASD
ncbi:hypothetical protein QWJ34_16260 [Saccharibacillus sp. CPCC 101409]|uniref:hypothetical protein n=1 Tax=Saccharibacillus sp. CPCC 101409 TaxID=3058041 RepID=UPI00267318C0|nr:hypothetical protein [Saccharibacillus sp. CPCC 101409]MDO3411320.1 hypothetical protein [Saccharibacillus sp. CPCC 101409]